MPTWKQVGGRKVPEPKPGMDEEFDGLNRKIDDIKKEFNDYLKDIKKDIGSDEIEYNTTSEKFRY